MVGAAEALFDAGVSRVVIGTAALTVGVVSAALIHGVAPWLAPDFAEALIGRSAAVLPGIGPKEILSIVAENDAQVPNLASDLAARSAGIPVIVGITYAGGVWFWILVGLVCILGQFELFELQHLDLQQ